MGSDCPARAQVAAYLRGLLRVFQCARRVALPGAGRLRSSYPGGAADLIGACILRGRPGVGRPPTTESFNDPFPVNIYNPVSRAGERSAVADLFRRLPTRTTPVR